MINDYKLKIMLFGNEKQDKVTLKHQALAYIAMMPKRKQGKKNGRNRKKKLVS
jgi:hypothetical protein